MGHGGARNGAGRKSKFYDEEGNPLKSKSRQVPIIVTDKDIQDLVTKKLADSKKEAESQCD